MGGDAWELSFRDDQKVTLFVVRSSDVSSNLLTEGGMTTVKKVGNGAMEIKKAHQIEEPAAILNAPPASLSTYQAANNHNSREPYKAAPAFFSYEVTDKNRVFMPRFRRVIESRILI